MTIKQITNISELDEVHQLNYLCYLDQGYCQPNESKRISPYLELDSIPETIVLAAYDKGEMIGSISFTTDGPEGLHVDRDFHDEVEKIRNEKKICSSWRVLTLPRIRNNIRIISALIRKTLVLIKESGSDLCLFTFNPKHEHVYQRILGMKTIAHKEELSGLNNAPAVLMSLSLFDVPSHFKEFL